MRSRFCFIEGLQDFLPELQGCKQCHGEDCTGRGGTPNVARRPDKMVSGKGEAGIKKKPQHKARAQENLSFDARPSIALNLPNRLMIHGEPPNE
jgi:hypothetical protein